MKVGIVVLGAVVSVALGALLFAAVSVFPTMLILGGLHHSGLTAIPALGFWQTFGSLFLVSTVGTAFRGSTVKQ